MMLPFRLAKTALDATRDTFSIPPDASSRSIRKSGTITVVCGLCALFLLPLPLFALSRQGQPPPIQLVAIPGFFGYALISVGGYRVLTGRNSFADESGPSFRRVGIAIAAFLLFVGVPLATLVGLMILFDVH
jgi:hypothetical protein